MNSKLKTAITTTIAFFLAVVVRAAKAAVTVMVGAALGFGLGYVAAALLPTALVPLPALLLAQIAGSVTALYTIIKEVV